MQSYHNFVYHVQVSNFNSIVRLLSLWAGFIKKTWAGFLCRFTYKNMQNHHHCTVRGSKYWKLLLLPVEKKTATLTRAALPFSFFIFPFFVPDMINGYNF